MFETPSNRPFLKELSHLFCEGVDLVLLPSVDSVVFGGVKNNHCLSLVLQQQKKFRSSLSQVVRNDWHDDHVEHVVQE